MFIRPTLTLTRPIVPLLLIPRPSRIYLIRQAYTTMADDDHTSRPATKRVRSDNDHSKGETKAREDDIQESKGGQREDGGDKSKHEDEEWLSKPPFSVGASKDGWKTKWRSSCWCGKSASRWARWPSTEIYRC